MSGWTTNARRTTCARRHQLFIGSQRLEDIGTIFTSAFASAAEDSACDFPIVWLGQGKADSPSAGRAGRSGDAECRAIVDTHDLIKRAIQEEGTPAVSGLLAIHSSGVPCLSCVGVAAQFKRCYPGVSVNFTFVPREQAWEAPDVSATAGGSQGQARSATPARSVRHEEAQRPHAESIAYGNGAGTACQGSPSFY